MRRDDELHFGKCAHQIIEDTHLPCGMQVQIKFIDQNDTGCFQCRVGTKVRIELSCTPSDVRSHRHNVFLTVG